MGLHPLWLYCGIDDSMSMNRPFDSFKLIQLRFLAFHTFSLAPWKTTVANPIYSVGMEGKSLDERWQEGRKRSVRVTLVRSTAKEIESEKLTV